MNFPHPTPPSYKPSVFYFRSDLRAATTVEEAARIATAIVDETGRLHRWAIEQNVVPETTVEIAAELMRLVIGAATSIQGIVAIGLCVCHELEELKRIVREDGLIPPKWEVSRHEARDKGWLLEEAV